MHGSVRIPRGNRSIHEGRKAPFREIHDKVNQPAASRGGRGHAIHQGNSATILSNGQPTIFFRPLLCANIH